MKYWTPLISCNFQGKYSSFNDLFVQRMLPTSTWQRNFISKIIKIPRKRWCQLRKMNANCFVYCLFLCISASEGGSKHWMDDEEKEFYRWLILLFCCFCQLTFPTLAMLVFTSDSKRYSSLLAVKNEARKYLYFFYVEHSVLGRP